MATHPPGDASNDGKDLTELEQLCLATEGTVESGELLLASRAPMSDRAFDALLKFGHPDVLTVLVSTDHADARRLMRAWEADPALHTLIASNPAAPTELKDQVSINVISPWGLEVYLVQKGATHSQRVVVVDAYEAARRREPDEQGPLLSEVWRRASAGDE